MGDRNQAPMNSERKDSQFLELQSGYIYPVFRPIYFLPFHIISAEFL